jgi:hypothetical protein
MRKHYHTAGYHVDAWLADLLREAIARAEALGPLTGKVRDQQKLWSDLIDKLAAEAQP